MHVMELHIYGYGRLENVKITSLENLQVFYGENEAGKSTIMSFIHSILFGFPTKQQAELRYEPKKSAKYGGLLKARFHDKGIAVIERVKGKAAGDVTVTLESGVVGGEELLTELLAGMDKGTYQNIFSFNLHGLQNIQQLKGEELGRYLFSASALGTDKLLQAENQLQKEMEQRFKPGGKKPSLNEKVRDLREVYEALKKAENENEEYDQLVTQKAETETRLADIQVELKDLEHRVYKLKALDRVLPLIAEEKQLESKVASNGEVLFPTEGLSRIERIGEQKQRVQARLSWLKERSEMLEAEGEKVKPNEELLAHETEVSTQLEAFQQYNQLNQEKTKLQLRLQEVREEIEHIHDQLHVQYSETSITEINTSVVTKESAEEVQLKQQQLKERKLTLDENFQDETRAMEELEKTAAFLHKKLMDDETRFGLEKQLRAAEEQEKLKDEYQRVQEQMASVKRNQATAKQQSQANRKRQGLQMLLLGLIFLALMISGFVNDQWILTGAGIVGSVLILFMYFRSGRNSHGREVEDDPYASLRAREQELKALLKDTEGLNVRAVREALEQDEANRRKSQDVTARLEQQNQRYERVIQSFEKWEAEVNELNRKQAILAENLMLPEETGKRKIYDSFLLVEKLKQLFREKSRVSAQLSDIEIQVKAHSAKYATLAEQFLEHSSLPVQDIVVLLKKKLREEIDHQAKHREVITKLSELSEEVSQLHKELQQMIEEETKLFEHAQVEDEESFRNQGMIAEQVNNWNDRLAKITLQLETAGISYEEREAVHQEMDPREQLERASKRMDAHQQEQSTLRDQLADLKHRMKQLEEGGLYADLLHKYQQMKFEFEEEAKEWAKYAVAKEVLAKTIDHYKTDRLPKLLTKAGEYLRFLTNEEYNRILPQESGSGFLIERKDHILFEANELSQATAEQVYVSLRLALTASLFSRYPFPIIIDDSFVNFDEKRAKRMFVLLRSFSANQILFFTCHKHLLEEFSQDEILRLKENSTEIVS